MCMAESLQFSGDRELPPNVLGPSLVVPGVGCEGWSSLILLTFGAGGEWCALAPIWVLSDGGVSQAAGMAQAVLLLAEFSSMRVVFVPGDGFSSVITLGDVFPNWVRSGRFASSPNPLCVPGATSVQAVAPGTSLFGVQGSVSSSLLG